MPLQKLLLNFIEGNSFLSPLGHIYNEIKNASNSAANVASVAKKALKSVCIGNIDRLIFGHLNINFLQNKSDLLCE